MVVAGTGSSILDSTALSAWITIRAVIAALARGVKRWARSLGPRARSPVAGWKSTGTKKLPAGWELKPRLFFLRSLLANVGVLSGLVGTARCYLAENMRTIRSSKGHGLHVANGTRVITFKHNESDGVESAHRARPYRMRRYRH